MIWESILFLLAFEASFTAVAGEPSTCAAIPAATEQLPIGVALLIAGLALRAARSVREQESSTCS